MRINPATGRLLPPDHALTAAQSEQRDLLAARAGLAIADLDARMAALALLSAPPPVEVRAATTADLNRARRTVTVIAAPYEQPTQVIYRGQQWTEVFQRGAFTGLDATTATVRVNRGHDKQRTVGKALRFDPDSRVGLIAEIRIAPTPLGDETLALAAEDMLSASVGFGVLPGGEQLDHRTRTRRITAATLDHIALVESPAYPGAGIVAVAAG